MSERSLPYREKSDFGGTKRGTGNKKPNQLYVCDTATQWLDFPRGLHFNELPVQLGGNISIGSCAKDIEIALTSLEHKRFHTPEEFLAKYIKDDVFSKHTDVHFRNELKSLRSLIQRDCYSRSVRVYDQNTETPDRSCIRKLPIQDCRTNRRQHQPKKIKPRPPKGRNNHHNEIRKFRRLQKRFKIFSLK